jgi:hypothetical protein
MDVSYAFRLQKSDAECGGGKALVARQILDNLFYRERPQMLILFAAGDDD